VSKAAMTRRTLATMRNVAAGSTIELSRIGNMIDQTTAASETNL
jgi:hypothetical protein